MPRLSQSLRSWMWVLAFALLLVVRTSDAHMHLCFDGQEPQSSLHVTDDAASHHNDDRSEAGHQDQDVEVDTLNPALIKKSAHAADVAPLPVLALVLMLLPPDRGIEPATTQQDPQPKLPYLFVPLLRGPPV